jgi:very-short-patch-repair endonuclease
MQEIWKRARELRHSATDAERLLWRHLRRKNFADYKFRRQYPIAGYILDFVCIPAKLIIELDGGRHVTAVEYDERRTRKMTMCGYRVVRFWNDDVFLRTEEVLEEIWRELHQR